MCCAPLLQRRKRFAFRQGGQRDTAGKALLLPNGEIPHTVKQAIHRIQPILCSECTGNRRSGFPHMAAEEINHSRCNALPAVLFCHCNIPDIHDFPTLEHKNPTGAFLAGCANSKYIIRHIFQRVHLALGQQRQKPMQGSFRNSKIVSHINHPFIKTVKALSTLRSGRRYTNAAGRSTPPSLRKPFEKGPGPEFYLTKLRSASRIQQKINISFHIFMR